MLPSDGKGSTHGQHQARRFIRQDSIKPLVTYSRKDRKPLPLTANQFRPSVYDLPDDVEAVDTGASQANGIPWRVGREGLSSTTKASLTSKKTSTRKAKTDAIRTISNVVFPPTRPARRRLAVNELFLVASTTDNAPEDYDPPSTPPRIDVQDPISEHVSSLDDRITSSSETKRRKGRKRPGNVPLSALRAQLKAPASRFKVVKKTTRSHQPSGDRRGRDGFDDSELKITPAARTKRVRVSSLTPVFGALHLCSGPLPEVHFEEDGHALELEIDSGNTKGEQRLARGSNDEREELTLHPPASVRTESQSEYTSATRKRLIASQLSSISAPARRLTDSDDGEDEMAESGDGEHEDDDPIENEDRATNSDATEVGTEHSDQTEVETQPDHHQSAMLDLHPSRPATQQRPILKTANAAPGYITGPSQTAANTRRNSRVNAAGSRYFTNALDALAMPDPARRVVIPSRRSSYFEPNFEEAEMLDLVSDAGEGEIEPYEYVVENGLGTMRKGCEEARHHNGQADPRQGSTSSMTAWSREHGTFSQVVGRKPSTLFKSRTKVR